jgi:hypothetical protein
VYGRTAAADIVTIHPVVMNEQIRLKQLECDHRWDAWRPRTHIHAYRLDWIVRESFETGGHERSAHAFSATKCEFEHGARNGANFLADFVCGCDSRMKPIANPNVDAGANLGEQHREGILRLNASLTRGMGSPTRR